MGQTMNLQELQKKMESQQATLAELLKVLKPANGSATPLELGSHDGPYQLPEPSLSVIKGWDSYREGGALPYGGPSRARRRIQKGNHASAGRHDGLTKRERFMSVEGYWRSLAQSARRDLLSTSVHKILQVAASEGGNDSQNDVRDALRLLAKNSSRHACYWRCPCCEMRTADGQAFLDHLSTFHEEVQYSAEDTPMLCGGCGQEVVGAFFYTGTPNDPSSVQCLRCAWDAGTTPIHPPPGWTLLVPQPTTLLDHSWSGSLASSEAATAASEEGTGDSLSEASASEEDDEQETSFLNTPPNKNFTDALISAGLSDMHSLECRVRDGANGLLGAVAHRIDTLARNDRPQFELALASVVQRAQRFMHWPVPGDPSQSKSAGCCEHHHEAPSEATPEARSLAAAALLCLDKNKDEGEHEHEHEHEHELGQVSDELSVKEDEQEKLRRALHLLQPSELQDLLALMARRYSPQPSHHMVPRSTTGMTPYQPMCVSLLNLSDDGNAIESSALASPSASASASASASPSMSVDVMSSIPAPGSGLSGLPELSEDQVVKVQGWWVDHLAQKSWHDLTSSDEVYVLQWLYGNVAHSATDEFLERQRLAWGTKPVDTAIMDAYGEVAETWRHLAATMDRKRHVSTLKDAVAEDVDAVAAFDPKLVANLRTQAKDFFQEVLGDANLAAAASGKAPMDAAWAQRALGKLQKFHQLKDEGSIRYAQALIDREIAVLELAEVMDQHECDVAERELQTVDAALSAARQDLMDAEAELARAQAEGPALHRRRDILDRVNKEAEHRERLHELQSHITACRERILSEETFGAGAQRRREEAASNLAQGRSELQSHLERRQALDTACHAVLAAQERDKGHDLTDEYVDARIRAVWHVVSGVADAIRGLSERYTSGPDAVEAVRHARCTALAQSLMVELDDRIRVWWDELDKLRRRAADLACVDAGQTVEAVFLECVRQSLESQAAEAREAATMDLLRELELEEAAKKAAETKRAKKKAKEKGKGKEKEKEKEKDAGGLMPSQPEPSPSSTNEEVKKEDFSPGGQAMDTSQQPLTQPSGKSEEEEYEAALERRRLELERQEAELLKLAQQASLEEKLVEEIKDGRAAKSKAGLSPGGPAIVVVPVSSGKDGKEKEKEKEKDKPGPRIVIVHRSSASNGSVASLTKPSKEGDKEGINKTSGGDMKVVNYYGDWSCYCGKINKLWDACTCGQIPPCRDWVRGRCTYKDRCRFAHPPFELPDSLHRPKSPIAKPGPDAVVYKRAEGDDCEIKAPIAPKTLPPASVTAPPPPPPPPAKVSTQGLQQPPPRPPPPPPPPPRHPPPPPPPPRPPQPLKPAPWAGVKPGAPVIDTPNPNTNTNTNATVAPAAEFDLFGGSNPLLEALGPAPVSSTVTSTTAPPPGFGPGLGMPSVQLFGGGGFGMGIGGFGSAVTEPHHQHQMHHAPPAPAPPSHPPQPQPSTSGSAGSFDSTQMGASRQSIPLQGDISLLQQQGMYAGPQTSVLGSGLQTGSLDHTVSEYEDWSDLQLQLPSDLGEMLGEDPGLMPSMNSAFSDATGVGNNTHGQHHLWGGF